MNKANSGKVRIEIDGHRLLNIIRRHTLSASDIRCLDLESKQEIQHLCLLACAASCDQKA